MNPKEKTQHLRIALAMTGVMVSDSAAEVIWRVQEKMKEKRGNFSLMDAAKIEVLVMGKLSKKKVEAEKEK